MSDCELCSEDEAGEAFCRFKSKVEDSGSWSERGRKV